MDLTIIAGPLIGAVIGYFTNYLAVKMLFRPRREIKIGSKTLPFTPGVIPKGKPRLARVADGRRHPGHRRGYQKEPAVGLYAGGCGR